MSRHDVALTSGNFLIVLRQLLVAEDIADTLCDRFPGAQVERTRGAEEALQRIEAGLRADLAFVEMSPAEFDRSDLKQALLLQGARIILLGDAAELAEEAEGFPVLRRPFSTVALLRVIDGLDLRRDP
ncbi:hypothetical protein SAMN05421688_1446 [Poseidonocella pacifica]|uniref:Response regulatory domain-containing protein n=1 Tax=Poseidonocella pacifica TaxID=871651 RepID=A0A1I0WJ64_9RHOB|nr:hypothetical protein [Poseidonocella pacifica]SFA88170.1 hypothetical protein SAMN05421688_1446 [Poseidonocella pacifica]